jgi:hypothetical protein
LWFAVTRNPTAEWLARQITEAFPWDSTPKYLIRDNDRAFGAAFKARVRAMGIRDRPTSFRSPWQNGYAERLIGSIRRECTDHLIVFNAEHLRRILTKYAAYYMGKTLKALALIVGLGVAQNAAASSLLVNGGFETPLQGAPTFAAFNVPLAAH